MPPRKYKSYRKRRTRKRRVPRPITNIDTHYFKRTASLTPLVATSTFDEITFALNALPNDSEFSALFDMYMITKIVLQFMPEQNVSDVANVGGARIPTLRCVTDRDGGGATNFQALGEMSHTDLYLNKPRTYTISGPAIQTELYRSVSTTAYSAKSYVWIDMGYVDVPHYSWKYAIYNTPPPNWTCPIFATYYFKCKGVR